MRRTALILAAGILLLTGCANTHDEPEATLTPEATPAAGCLTPTDGAVELLQADIEATIPGVTFVGAGAKAGEDPGFWYIGIKFEDPEIGEVTGIWGSMQDITTNEDPAFIAVDEMAEASSTYHQPADFDGVTATLVDMDDCITG